MAIEQNTKNKRRLPVSGLSGNEVFCLTLKKYKPGEIVVGNSVYSMGVAGSIKAFGRTLAGGEITNLSSLISEGRRTAIYRMTKEAERVHAAGITGVRSELRTLGGFTEYLVQGTTIHATEVDQLSDKLFTSAASGSQLFCQLDAGYQPIEYCFGNVAYALGVSRGITGAVRRFRRGEIHEYSQMYNELRHTALKRLCQEAYRAGGNAIVDIQIGVYPTGSGTIEFLLTGTASHHPSFTSNGSSQIVSSEVTGEELWNLAKLGWAPQKLVMATSVYSLGLAGGIGSLLGGMTRGEVPELTQLVYEARENCLDLLRREAENIGAKRVIGNRLVIAEIAPGLIEVFAVGTAVRRVEGIIPKSSQLPVQAIIVEKDIMADGAGLMQTSVSRSTSSSGPQQSPLAGLAVGFIVILYIFFRMWFD